MPQKIRKAVFPVAGMGTRFLPATKANPKEMLTVVDKPLIQYAAEEAVSAGITELIFVTGRNKRSIADHFDKAYELEAELELKNKTALLETVKGILPKGVSCIYLRQADALGLGHAVSCARPAVGNEPFAVLLADDLIMGNGKTCLQEMVETYEYHGCSVLGAQQVPMEDTSKYGVVDAEKAGDRLWSVSGMVEKPAPEDAPSNISVVGRYILTPHIFDLLETIPSGAGGEIQLTDAIAELLQKERVLAYEFTGKRYDCGDKLGYLQANVEYALKHDELGEGFAEYLRGLEV
ncbi:MAG TPA: UTP--glucose-1-phosphate uridylyltransferase GalU [Chromatiales bacterium]|nr:UTP--glucose-1-phosphate uridylyltransferase GalU [Thiotrichales bacterium]HIP67532.1 UTP--glucose-1-phosphate uridylyltransferase GalU [Chromatiales bacterium]